MLLVYCLSAIANTPANSTSKHLSFDEALDKKIISYKIIYATPPSTLENDTYGSKVWVTLTNNTKENISVTIPPGTLFQPQNIGYQTMIVTNNLVLNLSGLGSAASNIYGMCIHMRRQVAEGEKDTYTYLGKADSQLEGLARLIEKHNAQNHTGQMAIWSWTDDQGLSNIDHEDSKVQNILRNYIAKAKNWPLPKSNKKSIAIRDAEYMPVNVQWEQKEFLHKISGHFEFGLREISNVGIVMIKPDGSLHKKINVYDQQPPGIYDVDFNFSEVFEEEGNYVFRLYVNGQPKVNLKLNISNRG